MFEKQKFEVESQICHLWSKKIKPLSNLVPRASYSLSGYACRRATTYKKAKKKSWDEIGPDKVIKISCKKTLFLARIRNLKFDFMGVLFRPIY